MRWWWLFGVGACSAPVRITISSQTLVDGGACSNVPYGLAGSSEAVVVDNPTQVPEYFQPSAPLTDPREVALVDDPVVALLLAEGERTTLPPDGQLRLGAFVVFYCVDGTLPPVGRYDPIGSADFSGDPDGEIVRTEYFPFDVWLVD